jgi:hypothetical protein
LYITAKSAADWQLWLIQRHANRLGNVCFCADNAGCDGVRTELEPDAIGPHARLQRSEIVEHGRNEFRDGRMNVHRSLQDLVGGLGVHHVKDAVHHLVAGQTQE